MDHSVKAVKVVKKQGEGRKDDKKKEIRENKEGI